MLAFLYLNGFILDQTDDEIYESFIRIASRECHRRISSTGSKSTLGRAGKRIGCSGPLSTCMEDGYLPNPTYKDMEPWRCNPMPGAWIGKCETPLFSETVHLPKLHVAGSVPVSRF